MNLDPAASRPLAPWEEISLLHDEFERAARARREADLRCARALARLAQLDGLSLYGCASVGEFGERHGVSAIETRALLDLGRALPTQPLLERQIADGKITVAAGAIVAQALTRPELQEGEDDWIEWARTRPTRALARELRRREEKARNGGRPVVPIPVFVSLETRDDLHRSRVVASRKAGRALSLGETLGVVCDHFLDTFDEERVSPGERRCPPTALVNGRYVPRAVRREIFERQGQQCAVPMCEHTMFLEKAHLVPHASGGDREADNLVLLCSLHHFFLDTGVIHIVGTASKPRFLDDKGRDFATRYDPGGMFNEGRAGQPADAPAPVSSSSGSSLSGSNSSGSTLRHSTGSPESPDVPKGAEPPDLRDSPETRSPSNRATDASGRWDQPRVDDPSPSWEDAPPWADGLDADP